MTIKVETFKQAATILGSNATGAIEMLSSLATYTLRKDREEVGSIVRELSKTITQKVGELTPSFQEKHQPTSNPTEPTATGNFLTVWFLARHYPEQDLKCPVTVWPSCPSDQIVVEWINNNFVSTLSSQAVISPNTVEREFYIDGVTFVLIQGEVGSEIGNATNNQNRAIYLQPSVSTIIQADTFIKSVSNLGLYTLLTRLRDQGYSKAVVDLMPYFKKKFVS
jgi:hypothetical protein